MHKYGKPYDYTDKDLTYQEINSYTSIMQSTRRLHANKIYLYI